MNMDNPFGALEFLHWSHPWNKYKYSCREDRLKIIKLMKEAHVGWLRMDFLWEDIEPRQGEFDFIKYDEIVNLVSENNINILGILDYTASWATGTSQWNDPPGENKFFVDYAVKVVERYKDRIKYWEVWNEPDSSTYLTKQDGLKTYCALLKEVYIALKKTDPECKILNGGLANGPASINNLYSNGAKDYFDILNIHYFENPLNPQAIKAVIAYPALAQKIMLRNGDADKEIWVTEIGCPGVKSGSKVKNWWMGRNPNERQQAKWLAKVYKGLLKDKRVKRVFWAFFRDCNEHWHNGIDYLGLVRWDYSKKPAFYTFQKYFINWKKSSSK